MGSALSALQCHAVIIPIAGLVTQVSTGATGERGNTSTSGYAQHRGNIAANSHCASNPCLNTSTRSLAYEEHGTAEGHGASGGARHGAHPGNNRH